MGLASWPSWFCKQIDQKSTQHIRIRNVGTKLNFLSPHPPHELRCVWLFVLLRRLHKANWQLSSWLDLISKANGFHAQKISLSAWGRFLNIFGGWKTAQGIWDGPWPDPTRAYFWPAVNKRPTWLWPGYFPTRPEAIFFDVFRGNFPNSNPNHKWLTRLEPQKIDPTRVKNFWPGPITTRNPIF